MPTQSPFTAKEQLNPGTPLFFFDCTLADGGVQRWSSQTLSWNGNQYAGRVLRHNLFESQLASDTQVGGAPRLSFELANADSLLSQVERQSGFKGARLLVRLCFFDLQSGTPASSPVTMFRGLVNPPELITETSFRLTAMNRMTMQRSVLPDVRVQRTCPWRFPANAAQRAEAVDGGVNKGKYSPLYRCGYSPDQAGGTGSMNGANPFTSCSNSRSDCERRGMFSIDSAGRATARFGGIEFVPPTILVRGAGQKNYQLSSVQDNQARYNDFVPLIYGTQWHTPDVVFSRNDGNLTRMEVLLGMGEVEGILQVLVNGVQIPQGVSGARMTSTGWWNLLSRGGRNGSQDADFSDGHGHAQGDPYGSMAYLSVVVPNRINDGSSVPHVQVLMQGLRLWQFDAAGARVADAFSDNPAWVLLDVLLRCGYGADEIDAPSFAHAAAFAGELISVTDPVGGAVRIPRFQCNFALKQRRSAGEVIRAIRNASRLYLALNQDGLIEARVEGTVASQHAVKPDGSNAAVTFNGGWPAYEFDGASIARGSSGGASIRISSRGAQETPNRYSVEFQDAFNQYQQDSLSLADGDDTDLCRQEVAAALDGLGISSFNQAERMLLLALNRGIQGNLGIEFETSVKALGLAPGDLITVTWSKENLVRTPFRITKITPGASFRTAAISAQLHDDAWYGDTVSGIIGGRGWNGGTGTGLPSPVGGVTADTSGVLQLGVAESEVASAIRLDISFAAPPAKVASLRAPLIGLVPATSSGGGTLSGGTYFYAVSAVDADGAEGPMSFVAQANIASGSNSNSVTVTGIALPASAVAFHVYRGPTPQQLRRLASNQSPAPVFADAGLPQQAQLPPDPRFDHVNLYWRWELLPEASVTTHSATTAGNSVLRMIAGQYAGGIARITRGKGAGQDRKITSNTPTTFTIDTAWAVEPDASSYFVICENSWRFGATGKESPLSLEVPERIGAGVEIAARAANSGDAEAALELSPVTRWTLGQSGALAADADLPPVPVFGLGVSPAAGALTLSSVAFTNLANTRGITAGTWRFFYYDELNGPAALSLTAALPAAASTIALSTTPAVGTFIQIDQEILRLTSTGVDRGVHGTSAASHPVTSPVFLLSEKVAIVPFIRNFFGTPASGDWKSTVELPNIRLASVQLFMTNALGDGAIATGSYTSTIDQGLRTLSGGQLAFQISGFLAIQTGAAPDLILDADHSVRDIYGVLRLASSGAGTTLQINRNGAPWATVQFDPGSASSAVTPGFGLIPLRAGDQLSLDVAGVGTINPGSDLTLVIRL